MSSKPRMGMASRGLGVWSDAYTFVIYAAPALYRYADRRRRPNPVASPCDQAIVRFPRSS